MFCAFRPTVTLSNSVLSSVLNADTVPGTVHGNSRQLLFVMKSSFPSGLKAAPMGVLRLNVLVTLLSRVSTT